MKKKPMRRLFVDDGVNFSYSETMWNLEPDLSGFMITPSGEIVNRPKPESSTPVSEASMALQQEQVTND